MTVPLLPRNERHAITIRHWKRLQFEEVFKIAEDFHGRAPQQLRQIAPGALLGVLFYQNSTRTRLSFEAAIRCIGGDSIGFSDVSTTRAGDFFAESLEDTVRVLGSYADLLVLRHTDDDAGERAAKVSPGPVISAGSGEREHPTQGILDAWVIHRSLGSLEGAHVGLVGDPSCRALRSILHALTACGVSRLSLLMPEGCFIPDEEVAITDSRAVAWDVVESATAMVQCVDAICMIPFELPDFHVGSARAPAYRQPFPDRYHFSRKLLADVPVVVVHTGPRGRELASDADELPNVHYFDAVRLGVTLRAALLARLLGRV